MCIVGKYKDTNIQYCGSYELYFLEKIDKLGKINLIAKGESFKYIWRDKSHVYHTDFIFDGNNIEIKSSWTYNKNGKDLELEGKNKAKWKSVADSGKILTALIGKSSIDSFIISLQLAVKS